MQNLRIQTQNGLKSHTPDITKNPQSVKQIELENNKYFQAYNVEITSP